MAVFPHWVPLYKILQVVFATLCLLLTLKIADLLEIKRTPLILFPLILAYSFSWVSLTPHPDMLAMLFMLISLYFLLRYLREGKSVDGLMAVLSGFYGAMIREFALVTIFFAIFYFWCRYREKRRLIFFLSFTILLTGLGYYWVNCSLRDRSIFYPFLGRVDPRASEWYMSHVSLWSVMKHEPLQALGDLLKVFFPFFLMFFFAKPKEKFLASVFGVQIFLTLLFLPSTAGLDRYVMFTLPFLALAYANFWEKFPRRALVFMFVGMAILYPVQGYMLEKKLSSDFEEITEGLGPGDSVLFREYGQLAYRTRCKANWTSLFWSGDLFDSFENVNKVEHMIKTHGITHVLVDKEIILETRGPMVGNNAMKYPKEWVEKVENIGTKVRETRRYVLYRIG
ncbi:MAG: hypothetical protein DSO02_00235 [Hadesarchaea archaeon]|nr:MAG: hypothetical protein DSO02_00235 [Hadesarchaea archaeon]